MWIINKILTKFNIFDKMDNHRQEGNAMKKIKVEHIPTRTYKVKVRVK